jgi:hypothetical protein
MLPQGHFFSPFPIKSLCCSPNRVVCKPLFSSQTVIEFGQVTALLPSSFCICRFLRKFLFSSWISLWTYIFHRWKLTILSPLTLHSNLSPLSTSDASLARAVVHSYETFFSGACEAASGDGLSRYSNFCQAQSTKTGINGSIRKTQMISWKQRMESQEKHRNSKRKPDGLLKHCHSTALSGFREGEVV